MKFTFLPLIFFALLTPALYAQSGSSNGQIQQGTKVNWTIDPFEHALFVENKGQFDTVNADGKVLFESHLGAADAFFTSKGILYRHIETVKAEADGDEDEDEEGDPDAGGPPTRNYYYLSTLWEGANPNPTVVAEEQQTYYYTYPKGTNSSYFANVFKKITYQNLYPGIDVIYTFPEGSSNLKYTIVVHPGADLSKVHLNYKNPEGMKVDGSGNVVVKNDIGTLQESAPVSYYLEDNQNVKVSSQVTSPVESFTATGLDATKTLMIDPAITWSTNPLFSTAPDYAYDIDYDNLGNVYVYGGGAYPFQLIKLSPGGVIQWVYSAWTMTSTANFYGDFAVDKHSTECYIIEGWNSTAGAGARIQKIAPNGGVIATDPGNQQMNEMWRIAPTVCPAGFVIFGNGTFGPYQAAMVDTTMTSVTPANILGAAVTTGNHDMCLIATDPLGGSAYTATTTSLVNPAIDNNDFVKIPVPALAPNNYVVADGYAFKELGSMAYSGTAQFNAMNGMACDFNWLYSYDGKTLKQVNKGTGAVNKTAVVSGTLYTWGGLDVDMCGNVYVANNQTIDVYNSTSLTLSSTLPALSGVIYDLELGPYQSQLLYACGQGFVSELSLGAPIPTAITIQRGNMTCAPCTGVAKATLNFCGNPDTTNVTYRWSDGETTRTASHLCTGVDTVTITIGCSYIFKDTVKIVSNNTPLTVTTTQTNVTCTALGTATATVTNGTAPYTYLWNPSAQTNASATGLSAGTYTITATDKNGCTGTAKVTITQAPAVTVTATNTNDKCNAGNTATATATPAGGTAPFTYLWSPSAQTNATATGLTAGTYTITVTDNKGCTATTTVTVTQPTAISLTTATTQATCGSNNGSATVTPAGGTPAYTYLWTPSANTNANATGLTAGTYTITVTDNNGCTQTSTATVTTTPSITATISASTNILCNGSSTGSATVNPSGGVAPYTYLWNPSAQTNATATGLSAATYTITVTDNKGCIGTASVTITQPTAITLTPTSTAATCGNNNGTVGVTAAGGTPAYTYLWTPNNNSNANVTGLSAGTYTITVTDKNGCTQTATATITAPSSVTANITASTNILCNGNATGSATVTAAGGTAPYTYLWNPSGKTTATATGLSAASYTVTVTDNTGCSTTATVTLTQPPLLTATMGVPTNILCNGATTGSATVTAAGGSPGYLYNWLPNGGAGATGTGLSAGTYTVTVTDANNCTATASVTITQPTLLTATMGASTNILCNGGATGSSSVTAAGGSPAYTYAWTPAGGTNANATGLSANTYTITVTDANGCTATNTVTITQPTAITMATSATQSTCGNNNGTVTATPGGGTPGYTYVWSPSANTNATATGLSVGIYTVTVTDANGCTQTGTANVTSPSTVSATITASTNILCNGGTTGSATVTAAGGTAPYTYLWTPSAQTSATATGLSAAIYTVTVTDNAGCSVVATVTITQPTLLTATMGTPTNVLCNGGATGSATVTAAGGTPVYTYAWAPAGGNTATGTGLSAGTYTVTVTDNNGCTATAPVTITQPTALTANISATVNVTCSGLNNGSLAVTVAGGSPAYTYAWTPGGGTSAIVSGLSVGSYTVTVTDANGCTATTTGAITQPAAITAAISTTKNITCFGLNNGSLTVTPAGGSPAYTYAWSPVGGTAATASNLSAGTYTITVTDANGCSTSTSGKITEPTQLTVTAGGATTICSGGTAFLSSTPGGGTGPYTYAWTPAGGTNQNPSVIVSSTTTYTVTVTDANGCTATAGVTVTTGPPLTAVVSGATSFCEGGWATLTVNVSGGSNYKYLWTPGNNTTQTINVNPTSTTTYTVTVTDACGSIISVPVTVTVNPSPVTSFQALPLAGCAPFCVQFRNTTTISSGGIASYLWEFGNGQTATSTNPVFCYSDPGTYDVTLTTVSDSGCSSKLTKIDMITVYPHPDPTISYSPQPVTLLTPTVQFTSTNPGGSPIVYWSWTFGDATDSSSVLANPTHTYSDTGTYCVTLSVVDQHGCTANTVDCIVFDPLFTFYIPNAFSPNDDGVNDIFLPKGNYIKSFEMYIFDRWGMKLFYTNDIYNGWNGKVGNHDAVCQEDTYVYLINVDDTQGNKHSYVGKVNLIK